MALMPGLLTNPLSQPRSRPQRAESPSYSSILVKSMELPSTQETEEVHNNGKFLDQWNEKNFLVVWNIQSQFCSTKHGVDIHLDVEKYGIVCNNDGAFYGDEINIFYTLGKFPYIKDGADIDGGIPQLGDLAAHEQQVTEDVQKLIPNPDFRGRYSSSWTDVSVRSRDESCHYRVEECGGLGVIDWEAWRPSWDTNWSPFNIYRERSVQLVEDAHGDWNKKEVLAQAREDFETSARNFMQSALINAKELRPKAYWGYYGFPAGYNYETMQKSCSEKIMKSNDDIMWLFNTSTAIFPSIYIGEGRTAKENAVYVYGILSESQRVANQVQGRPILPYAMLFYRDTKEFLKTDDLFATICQAAALGFPGVILWAPYKLVCTPTGCKNIQDYVHTTLGPTIQKIRSTLCNRLDYLSFPDTLPNEKWLDRIIEFYEPE